MKAFLEDSALFFVLCGIVFYLLGDALRKKLRSPFLNPLIISVALSIALLVVFDIDYAEYKSSASFLGYLLTPTTVCLAIPLYRQLHVLRGNAAAILAGIISGALSSLVLVLGMSLIFGLSHVEYVTLLPKSITTAIGMSLSEELSGNPSLTAAAIMVTGVFGNAVGEAVLGLFGIGEPIARGVALGTASHAIGTSKAMELGETEGAVSSLSIVVAGIVTVVAALFFAELM